MVYYTLKGGERIATATVKRLLPPACARRALNKYNGTKAVQNYSLLAYNPAVGWHTLTDARLMKIDIVRGSAERGLDIWGWHNKLICSNQRRTIKWSPAANTPKAYKAAARGVLLYMNLWSQILQCGCLWYTRLLFALVIQWNCHIISILCPARVSRGAIRIKNSGLQKIAPMAATCDGPERMASSPSFKGTVINAA